MERNVMWKTFAQKNIGTLVLDNPIVLRDLRATMRGTRSFWVQGVYLLLLGVIALTGYASATGQSLIGNEPNKSLVFDVVNAQSRLQQFYFFIFATLASLITLIAPALTATSVSDERQRQSLDLLVTTPLSAAEMLVGKLMSSLAFLGLLLLLSLPASVLCILLGGATIGDVFRIYFMLAIDAVVLASIGLYFSCACKNSLQSLLWTYCSVALFTGLLCIPGTILGYDNNRSADGVGSLLHAISALSPFFTFQPIAGQSIALGPVSIPTWLALVPVAFLTVRLILTAAAYRLGMFGGSLAHSLRKQVLGITAITTFAIMYSFMAAATANDTSSFSQTRFYESVFAIWVIFAGLFCIAMPFLPALFVPVRPEDAPPGEAEESHVKQDVSIFRPETMLHPRHSGALPYYFTWLLVATAGIVIPMLITKQWNNAMPTAIAAGLLYAGGAGTLIWGLSRLAAQWLRAASAARALSFGLFMLTIFVPTFLLTIISMNVSDLHSIKSDLSPFMLWLGSPFVWATSMYQDGYAPVLNPILISGFTALVSGLLLGIFAKPKKV